MASLFGRLTRRVKLHAFGRLDRNHLLTGRLASFAVRSVPRVSRICDVEFQVYSQWGEDGIIDWLIERLAISNTTFVEFGVEKYLEANTRFLLENRNWRGLIMDGNAEYMAGVKADDIYWRHDLTAVPAFIDRDNVNDLIGSRFSGEIGLLSVDIDGNDYWVWERITAVNPIIVICEYNAVFGDTAAVSIPYDPAFARARAHPSTLYFGASLPALLHLAKKKGYVFVGTNLAGCNAFFVREDYAPRVCGLVDTFAGHPLRAREARDEHGDLSLISGLDRFRLISSMPVIDVVTGEQKPLRDIGEPYSPAWR
jgi:hypothetical protein